MDIKNLIIYEKNIPEREAEYADYPKELNEQICDYLCDTGIKKLYSHQTEMFERVQEKQNVVITTSTASGKTLSFLLPVLHEILKDPLTRAIFIYPTKALASDQYRALQPYLEYFGEERISAGVYDGDTSSAERSRIRKNANIILTNPEMINGSFLPNHSKFGFDFIFSNLKYVVIDELHTYRGAFGSHLANVFRRLNRVCRYYRSEPRFLCSSATIANPLELAEGICGGSFVQIERDGSPAAERKYCLIQPPRILGKDNKVYGQEQVTSVAAGILPALAEQNISFISFARSRRNVEVILKESRDRLEAAGFLGADAAGKISGYRGGYTPLERREIEHKMISGELCGLISTNALELGIDIGKISCTVLAGYPGTRASFWQQTGRAGRSGKGCVNYLILDYLPFDQYIGVNPDWLFEHTAENAVIDKNNLLIELAHIRAAAAELPLTLDDISVFPDLGETIPVLLKVKEVVQQNGKFSWSGPAYPAGDYNLRNIDKDRYKLVEKESGRTITEMDEMQAFRELHTGAVYMHDGSQYQILEFDKERKTAYGVPFEGNYYTMPGGNTNIRAIHTTEEKEYKRTGVSFGDINVDEMVYMFKKLQFHNHQNLGFEQLEEPLAKDFDTESTWIRIPENVAGIYRGLMQENESGTFVRNNHFEGMGHAIKNAAMLVTMTELEDIGYGMSANAVEFITDSGDTPSLYIYDKYVGGLGYAEKIYDLIPEIIDSAVSMIKGCACEDGCAACIGDYRLDKKIVLWGLENLLEEKPAPTDIKLVKRAPFTFKRKQFSFADLPERWTEFCGYVRENGSTYAGFLAAVPKVAVRGNTLIFYLNNAFYQGWIMEDENRKSLINILRFYADAPGAIQIEVQLEGEENKENTKKKLERRYEDLSQ